MISCCLSHAVSQDILTLTTGDFPLRPISVSSRSQMSDSYLIYSPGHLLSTTERELLQRKGLTILYALKQNRYWVKMRNSAIPEFLPSLADLPPTYKLSPQLYSRAASNQFRISVAFTMSKEEVLQWAAENITSLFWTSGRFHMVCWMSNCLLNKRKL